MQNLINEYKKLINIDLPDKYTFPVNQNHCFNRIILDWLYQDCWYNHLDRRRTAISQLTENQLVAAIARMKEWMQYQHLLIADNDDSITFRRKMKNTII